MYRISMRMTALSYGSIEAIMALQSIRNAARIDRGFIEGRIYQEVDNPDALCFVTVWASESELKSHIRSICFTELLMLMETSPVATTLKIYSDTEVFGLKYIERVTLFRSLEEYTSRLSVDLDLVERLTILGRNH
jgi:quinol monooxygenase YgiN